MALSLNDSQKAQGHASHDDGTGTLTDLGLQFHFTVADETVASLQVVEGGAWFVVAHAVGTTNIHFTTMDGSLSTDVGVTVTASGGGGGNPGAPALVVTFDAPVAQ